jgi:hypothetical protein
VLVKALPKGQYLKHFQYGCGVITESDEERTSIDFDVHGEIMNVTTELPLISIALKKESYAREVLWIANMNFLRNFPMVRHFGGVPLLDSETHASNCRN